METRATTPFAAGHGDVRLQEAKPDADPETSPDRLGHNMSERQKPTDDRVPCLVISFSPSQTARPLLGSVSDSWKL